MESDSRTNHTANLRAELRNLPDRPVPRGRGVHPAAQVRDGYTGQYKLLATYAASFVNPKTGRLRASYERLAACSMVSRRTAIRAMHALEAAGLFQIVQRAHGRGRKVNEWAFMGVGKHATPTPENKPAQSVKHDKAVSPGIREASNEASLKPKTITPTRARFETQRKPETRPQKPPRLQESDASWRRWICVAANDPTWIAFRDACRAAMFGLPERDLFRVWCRQVRRGADPQRMLAGWKDYLAACRARGLDYLKRPDNFVMQRWYELDWPMPEVRTKPPKDETYEQRVERRARAAGCWPARGGETWDQLWQRVLQAEARRAACA